MFSPARNLWTFDIFCQASPIHRRFQKKLPIFVNRLTHYVLLGKKGLKSRRPNHSFEYSGTAFAQKPTNENGFLLAYFFIFLYPAFI
jgi:hypothetical protein